MPDTGLKNSPRLVKGALVQLIEDIIGVVPNIIPFQYNPTKLSYQLTPWNPFEVDQTQRGSQAPNVQPFDPKESFTLSLELDAADELVVAIELQHPIGGDQRHVPERAVGLDGDVVGLCVGAVAQALEIDDLDDVEGLEIDHGHRRRRLIRDVQERTLSPGR